MKRTISAILSLVLAVSAFSGCTANAPISYTESIRPMSEYDFYFEIHTVSDSLAKSSGYAGYEYTKYEWDANDLTANELDTNNWNDYDLSTEYSNFGNTLNNVYSSDYDISCESATDAVASGNDDSIFLTAKLVDRNEFYPKVTNVIACNSKDEVLKAINKATLNLETAIAVKSDFLPTSDEIFDAMANSNALSTTRSSGVTYYSFDYPSGVKVAQAYKSGDTSNLNSDEKKLLENAKKILAENTSKSNTLLQNEQAIHDYIIKHTKYVDNGDSSQTAIGAINNGESVCAGYADAFNMFMKMLGYDCCYVTGIATSSIQSGPHAWNIIKIDGEYKHVDVCWDDPIGRTSSTVRQTYFNISADEISKNHIWAKEYYPA